ncbi:aromatic acid exporter family protein [Paenibacillus sp. N1-5-1-14]|uniref:aromatic acid exporter family protein n=1 Tax=Paenibacillus radicibacter TaxID=2972488 RepID=UPI002159A6CF|nr:aromatic acid exporter family protein [Paenibacillus radicibacter]MCR8644682.1 aromatic acid exporter family protein [Paenibacillus radicibacter]
MTFGARVLKTGMAVTLSLFISTLFQFSSPVIAAVAAIFAMQPSIYRSWRYFLEQLQTNTLGAILALLGGFFFSKEPLAVGFVCILVIMLCLKLKMEETIGLTLVTVIAVMEASGNAELYGDWQFALNRFLLILIGMCSAFLINILFFPPKPKEQFGKQIHTVFSKLSLLLRTTISNEIKESVYRDEKQTMDDSLKSISDKYKLFEEELKKMKKAKYSQARDLVIYKKMLQTMSKGAEVLDVVEEHYFHSPRTPEIDAIFDHHLEKLTKFHEHTLLKFEDMLKPACTDDLEMEELNEQFMTQILDLYESHKEGMHRMMIVATVIYDYGYQILRLDKVVEHHHRGTD